MKLFELSKEWIVSLLVEIAKFVERPIIIKIDKYCRNLPVEDNYILFEGRPDFSDNPRALCDYLIYHGYASKYKIFYIVKDVRKMTNQDSFPYINFLSAKNLWGIMPIKTKKIVYTASLSFASHSFSQPFADFKSGQRHILLWHGCGYKGQSAGLNSRFFDLALVPGQLFVSSKCRYWNTTPEFILCKGYPRYDWLISPGRHVKGCVDQLKKQYNISKIIIWMPTFRNSVHKIKYRENSLSQFPLMENKGSWTDLNEVCKNNNVLLIVKLHMSQRDICLDFAQFSNIVKMSNDSIENLGYNLYEFLAYTDALITDYSSIAIDYLLINKPIAFVLDDFENYKNARGFIFDQPKKYMPGHHIYKIQDLFQFVSEVSNDLDCYKYKRQEISSIAIYKSECYCKSIIDSLGI